MITISTTKQLSSVLMFFTRVSPRRVEQMNQRRFPHQRMWSTRKHLPIVCLGQRFRTTQTNSKQTSIWSHFVLNDVIPVCLLIEVYRSLSDCALKKLGIGQERCMSWQGVMCCNLMLYFTFRRPLALALDCKHKIPFYPNPCLYVPSQCWHVWVS